MIVPLWHNYPHKLPTKKIIHFLMGFPLINHPAMGVSPKSPWNPHKTLMKNLHKTHDLTRCEILSWTSRTPRSRAKSFAPRPRRPRVATGSGVPRGSQGRCDLMGKLVGVFHGDFMDFIFIKFIKGSSWDMIGIMGSSWCWNGIYSWIWLDFMGIFDFWVGF